MGALATTPHEVPDVGETKKDKEARGELGLDDLRKKALASRFKDELNWQDLSHQVVAERSAQGLKTWNVSDVVNERSLNVLMMWKVADGLGIKLSVLIARAEEEIERRLKEGRNDDT